MSTLFSAHIDAVYLFYGMAFVVLGVVAQVLPRLDATLRFAPHLWLVGAFGLLHGANGFLEWTAFRHPAEAAWAGTLGGLLRIASYAALLEFGRRCFRPTWEFAADPQPGERLLPALAVHGGAAAGVLLTVLASADLSAGVEIGGRYFIAVPGALLAGWGLLAQAEDKREGSGRDGLSTYLGLGGLGFIAYGLLCTVVGRPDPNLPAWLPTQQDFLAGIGVPVQLLRALIAVHCAVVFTRIAGIAGSAAQKRLMAALVEARHLNAGLERRGAERTRAIERINAQLRSEVNERELTVAALRQSEDTARVLLNASADVVYLMDQYGVLLAVNDAAARRFGASAAALVGRSAYDYLPRDLARQRRANSAQAVRTGQPVPFVESNGTQMFDTRLYPVLDETGWVTRLAVYARDITERKKAEEVLLVEHVAIESSINAIAMAGLNGLITYANRAFLDLWRLTQPAQVLGHLPGEFISDAPMVFEATRRDGRWQGEVQGKRFDGTTMDIQISAHMATDARGRPVCLMAWFLDVTERKRVERQRQVLEGQLRQSQKMEAIGTLAGGVAHDFNNIIGAILGNAALACEDIGEDHRARESIAEIDRAGRRARDLVQQILAFSRKQPQTRSVIALAPVIEDVLKLLRATLPAGVRLAATCAADTPNILADSTQIHQVLMNLCTNAWHAMEGRPGDIDVRLDAIAMDAGAAGARAGLRPGRYARLSVTDTGKGMNEAIRERIFEPFFTTKPVGEGTGLGLSVVHGIVQGHEGAITVDSAPGKGTSFRLYFPAVELPVAAGTGTASISGGPRQGRGQHVLYLDDDDALVSLVSRMLTRNGYRISGFSLAQDALDAVRADPLRYDLVVTDFNMPGMSGLDVACELGRIRPGLPVAVTSGYITDELRRRAPECGVRHLIYKPDTVDELCEVVRRLTEQAHAHRGG